MKQDIAAERKDKMKKMESERRAQEKLNQAFMVDDENAKRNAANKTSLNMFDSMNQVLNQITKQQNIQKHNKNQLNDSMSSGKK